MNKHRPIRAFLFDFGGVLAEEGFKEGLRVMAQRQGLDADSMPARAMDAVYDSGYVLGTGTEAEFWSLLRARTGLSGADQELTEEVLSRFVLRPWMLDWVKHLRHQGYTIGLLSDQTDWLQRLDAREHFLEAFEHIFVSYDLGKGKRDPTLFDEVTDALQVAPSETVFIDDSPGNIQRAQQQGLQGILYRDRQQFEREMASLIGEGSGP